MVEATTHLDPLSDEKKLVSARLDVFSQMSANRAMQAMKKSSGRLM